MTRPEKVRRITDFAENDICHSLQFFHVDVIQNNDYKCSVRDWKKCAQDLPPKEG